MEKVVEDIDKSLIHLMTFASKVIKMKQTKFVWFKQRHFFLFILFCTFKKANICKSWFESKFSRFDWVWNEGVVIIFGYIYYFIHVLYLLTTIPLIRLVHYERFINTKEFDYYTELHQSVYYNRLLTHAMIFHYYLIIVKFSLLTDHIWTSQHEAIG